MAEDSAADTAAAANSISGDGQAVRACALTDAPEASSGQTNGVHGHEDGSARPPVSAGAVVTADGNWSTGRGTPGSPVLRDGNPPVRRTGAGPDRVHGGGGRRATLVPELVPSGCTTPRSGAVTAPGATGKFAGSTYVYGNGRYAISRAQFDALRRLSWCIVETVDELLDHSILPHISAAARAAGIKPCRFKALLAAHMLDDQPETIGHLRRPRRSTLLAIATALDLPQPAVVVDLWCKHAPDAIAYEGRAND